MEAQKNRFNDPTRRQFVQRAVTGASLLGLGAATGALAGPSKAAFPSPSHVRELDKKFTYDLSGFTTVDPKLIGYEEATRIASGFGEIRSVRVGLESRIFAAGDQSVRIFSSDGAKMGEIALDERPRCLALGENDLIYVGMERHVQVYDPQGSRQAKWENLGGNAVITSIAAAKNDIFVADAGNRVVVRFDLSGKQLGLIGKKDPARNILGFVVPSPYFEVDVGPDGLVWAVNPAHHRIEAYTFEGDPRAAWGQTANSLEGFCGCCNPIHFTRLADGRFVTAEKGLPRVKVYSAKGEFECVVAAPDLFPSQLENPRPGKLCMSLAADAGGRILLADSATRQIRVFTRKS
jgi:hypothetical protein